MLLELLTQNRSCRRFDEGHTITQEEMHYFLECARLTPSTGNQQALKYAISCTPKRNALIQPCTGWGKGVGGVQLPEPGHRPTAFFVILLDHSLTQTPNSFLRDAGIVAQTVLLAATEKGLGGCMIGSLDRPQLSKVLNLPDHLEPLLVVALGKPEERSLVVPLEEGKPTGWYSEDGLTHYLPKRSLEELLVE